MVMTVGQAADAISEEVGQAVSPRDLTAILYQRRVRVELFPNVGGRRLIDPQYLPLLVQALRRAGKLSGAEVPV
ncbi:MAG: hypothetical protein AAGA92_15680 [Planctomycetota bacterium]